MLRDDEPPKSSWRPRKSTKSWDQLSVQKFTKVTQSREKVHRMGRIGPTEPRGVEGMYQNSRCASREKTWVQSTKKLNENWDAISLVFLSAVLWENFSSFRSTLHNFKPYCAFLTCGIDHSYEARVKCKIRYDGGLITWISAKPTDWIPEVNYHTSWKMAKISIMRRSSCSSLSRVLSTRSPCCTSPTSSTSLSQDYENFIMCPATIRSENMSEQAQRDLLQTQSQDDEQARKDPLPSELPWGKM